MGLVLSGTCRNKCFYHLILSYFRANLVFVSVHQWNDTFHLWRPQEIRPWLKWGISIFLKSMALLDEPKKKKNQLGCTKNDLQITKWSKSEQYHYGFWRWLERGPFFHGQACNWLPDHPNVYSENWRKWNTTYFEKPLV